MYSVHVHVGTMSSMEAVELVMDSQKYKLHLSDLEVKYIIKT